MIERNLGSKEGHALLAKEKEPGQRYIRQEVICLTKYCGWMSFRQEKSYLGHWLSDGSEHGCAVCSSCGLREQATRSDGVQ